jgi:hypothetical protein
MKERSNKRRRNRYSFQKKHIPVNLDNEYKGKVLDISSQGISFQLYDISLPDVVDNVLDLSVKIPGDGRYSVLPLQVVWHRFDYFGARIIQTDPGVDTLVESIINHSDEPDTDLTE